MLMIQDGCLLQMCWQSLDLSLTHAAVCSLPMSQCRWRNHVDDSRWVSHPTLLADFRFEPIVHVSMMEDSWV